MAAKIKGTKMTHEFADVDTKIVFNVLTPAENVRYPTVFFDILL